MPTPQELPLLDRIKLMLAEVKANKGKKGQSPSKQPFNAPSAVAVRPPAPRNPWQCESIVLVTTTRHCKCCGRDYTFPEPYLYLKRVKQEKKGFSPSIEITRLESFDHIEEIYPHLPKGHEHINQDIPTCQACFDDLPLEKGNSHFQYQQELAFSATPISFNERTH